MGRGTREPGMRAARLDLEPACLGLRRGPWCGEGGVLHGGDGQRRCDGESSQGGPEVNCLSGLLGMGRLVGVRVYYASPGAQCFPRAGELCVAWRQSVEGTMLALSSLRTPFHRRRNVRGGALRDEHPAASNTVESCCFRYSVDRTETSRPPPVAASMQAQKHPQATHSLVRTRETS